MKVSVSGASGYIGSSLCDKLLKDPSLNVTRLSRESIQGFEKSPELSDNADWTNLLNDIDVFIHCAGLAHETDGRKSSSLERYLDINLKGTLQLARQVIGAGVKRFIYFSSASIHGLSSGVRPLTERSSVEPLSFGAISKALAEEKLRKIFEGSDTELVILRLPLVYSFNAPGNFKSLLIHTAKGTPLPFKRVFNRRSLLSVNNLSDLVLNIVKSKGWISGTFMVSDDETISLSDIIQNLALGMGVKNPSIPVPTFIFVFFGRLFNKMVLVNKLIGDFEVDCSRVKQELNWSPPFEINAELQKAGFEYKNRTKY
ncbi:MAG: NAD-dependent epimerase/dehydratase family protein [Alteromonadaceae bacterium]|nr:NAD-dependent epimerase/dehydratase family protein [Alteromonadaceae bacterium]